MTRGQILPTLAGVLGSTVLAAFGSGYPKLSQAPAPRPPARQEAPKPPAPTQLPPEEDETEKPTNYSFNPIQARHEFNVGMFYWHKPNYKAAAERFEEATKWDPSFVDAYLRLAEAKEKLKHADEARAAYRKVVEISPDSKQGHEAKKKLAGKL